MLEIEKELLRFNVNKRLACFGTGSLLRSFMKTYPLCQPEIFYDNDIGKIGEDLFGREIKNPQEILEIDKADFLIIITSSFENEIALQLNGFGLEENKDFII